MTLLQLQYFETLARILHYTRAAEELHIAQPSLSYSIGELEKELGVKLFEKENRKITLTEYGERFLPYVQKSLLLMDEGTSLLKRMSGSAPMTVRLGYFHSISSSLIPNIIEEFYRDPENKKIRFQFIEDTASDISSLLKNEKLDLAFTTTRHDWAESITIMKQPLYLAVSLEHPLAKQHAVTFSDYMREPHIVLDKGTTLRTQFDQSFKERGVIPNIVFEVHECNAALQYVSLNFGVSILPIIPAMKTERIAIIPIAESGKEFVRTVYLSWNKGHQLPPAVQKVRNLISDQFAISTPI